MSLLEDEAALAAALRQQPPPVPLGFVRPPARAIAGLRAYRWVDRITAWIWRCLRHWA